MVRMGSSVQIRLAAPEEKPQILFEAFFVAFTAMLFIARMLAFVLYTKVDIESIIGQ